MSVTVPDTTNEMPSTGDEDTTTTTTTYTYDQHANRASDSSKPGPYDYDQANRLKGYRDTTYAYDGDGLRTSKTTPAATQPHTWDITAAIPQIIGDAGTAYITGPDGLPVQQITTDGAVAYYHQDQLGSTRAITNQTASVLATYDYDPYGNPTTKTATLTTPFGYGGQYTDTETGLQYLRARYYDPQTQNFLTRDPITPLTRAPYNYTDNNPTNNTDPTGLACMATSISGGTGTAAGTHGLKLVGALVPDFPDFDDVKDAIGDVGGYIGNIDESDIGHAALGVYEIADGAALAVGGGIVSGICYGGVSGAPVVGQIAGYPACTVGLVGTVTASSLSINNGINQLGKVDLTE